MRTKNLLFTIMFLFLQVVLFAQNRTVKGTVKDAKTNETMPGVTVLVEGTTVATSTDINGSYSITVDGEGKKLVFTSVGYLTQTVPADKDVVDISLGQNTTILKDVVVTAMGISREKKSLGYATQEISGDKLTEVKSGNFVNQISGKVAGVQVKNSGNMGGSTNVVIRGSKSMLGNNQALFVIDGIPMDNTQTSGDVSGTSSSGGSAQASGRSGYDYGNPISDINPEDIESMNVLKGAAATALYGARAANGVIIITTKKGRKGSGDSRARFGVTLNTNFTVGIVDKSTFPKYQNKYGGGYGSFYGPNGDQYFQEYDVNGDGTPDKVVPTTEDASWGGPFDPNLMVYHWDAFVPESKNYKKAKPWVSAGKEGPISFFNKSFSNTNGVSIDGGGEKSNFRVSYAGTNQTGLLPNSTLKRNNLGFGGSMQINDNLSASATVNYVKTKSVGRNETGYNNNGMGNFRQWWQTNVSVVDQKEIYDKTGLNYSWNPKWDPTNPYSKSLSPIFWDNPYFQRNESYNSDERDRVFGNITLNYKINDAVSIMGRTAIDQYSTLQEERLAVGSIAKPFGTPLGDGLPGNASSGYSKYNKNFRETNFDLMVNFKKDINENFSFSGLVGTNVRRTYSSSTYSSTNGGLGVPKLYTLSNSKQPINPATENEQILAVNGFFGSASFGYKRFLYLDVTARQDYSSTLPEGKNGFFYPGVSGSFVFSEKIKNASWLDFGKIRLNYANVGNDAPFASINDVYAKPPAFGGVPLFSMPNAKNNPTLKPEISSSAEAGLEMVFFKKRLGFDFAAYNTLTKDQIVPVSVSPASGYSQKFVNAGIINNKGIELNLYGTPVQTQHFKWTVNFNFAKNVNKVIELFDGVDNLQLANFQGGITLNATVGESYGTLKGTDFVYLNGKKVVGANGRYLKTTTTDNVIGNINPKFIAGITNSFTYKNVTASFLIDMQQGGSLFSLDMYYGLATGVLEETAGLNDLGNPVRSPLSEGGGVILDGVTANGEVNTTRAAVGYGFYGYRRNPDKPFIYDASYIKLREVAVSYKVPFKKEAFFSNAMVGIVASNLWIIHKNLPHADPEAGLGAGNIQGYQVGVMPATRNFGFNLTLQF